MNRRRIARGGWMTLGVLVAVFIVLPILEIVAVIQVGRVIGPWWTIALLIVNSVLGAWLLRSAGTHAWRAFQAAVESRRIPTTEIADGVLIILGGALLLTPGFVSDTLGFICVLPPTRRVIRNMVLARWGWGGGAGPVTPPGGSPEPPPDVVPGEVIDPERPHDAP